MLLALLALLYGVSRFCLDFLRATDLAYVDARYFGLTPAQYACLGLMAWGVFAMLRKPRPCAVGVRASKPMPLSRTSKRMPSRFRLKERTISSAEAWRNAFVTASRAT